MDIKLDFDDDFYNRLQSNKSAGALRKVKRKKLDERRTSANSRGRKKTSLKLVINKRAG